MARTNMSSNNTSFMFSLLVNSKEKREGGREQENADWPDNVEVSGRWQKTLMAKNDNARMKNML